MDKIVGKIFQDGWQADLSGIRKEIISIRENADNLTYTVTVKDDGSFDRAVRATSQLIVAERLLDERLPTERIDDFKAVFDYPVVGRVYSLDWVLKCPTTDELFRVAQPQITYERTWNDFTKFPALFAPFRSTNNIQPWVKPTGAHDAYAVGDRVTHKGFTWESRIPANTTEPEETVFNWWVKV